MSIRTRNHAAAGILAIVFSVALGCASTPVPTELINARRAYQEAQQSPAASLSPAEMVTARQALQRAESAFENEPDSQRTRDLAYVAERRAQWAKAVGNILYAQRQIAQAQREYVATQSQIQQQTASELARVQQQHAADQQKLAQSQEQVQAEREARLSAEQRAREAILGLGKVAGVRQDHPRGTVITLSGTVLFASGHSSLLPMARERLNQVAEALKQQPAE